MTAIVGGTLAVSVLQVAGPLDIKPRVAMSIRTPYVDRAPTSLSVVVGGVDPGAAITFSIDGGSPFWTAYADAEGFLAPTSIPVPYGTLAGFRQLSASTVANGSAVATFTLNQNPSLLPELRAADANPVAVPNSTGRWVLQDVTPGGLGSWVMPINPSAMTPPEHSRPLSDQHTTAPASGRHHISEGAPQTQPWKLQGYCPNAAFDAKMEAYRALGRRLYVIDHRARAWTCIVLDYSLELRKRKAEDTGVWNDHTGNWTMDLEIVGTNWKVPL